MGLEIKEYLDNHAHQALSVYRPFPFVSYPDPNVRNDDYRLQYNITYRGSGNEVVGNGSWNVVGMLRIT